MKILLATILLFNFLAPALPVSSGFNQPNAPVESLNLTSAEIAALVNECGERTTRMTRRIYDYTYTLTTLENEVDKRGQVAREKSKVYEVSPFRVGSKKGGFASVQVSEDGVPFSAEKINRGRERAVKLITEAEEKEAQGKDKLATSEYKPRFSSYGIVLEQRQFGGAAKSYYPLRPTDFLVWHEFYSPRRTVLKNREAILLNFRSRPGYVYDQTNVPFSGGIETFGRVMAQLGGRVWIDATDKVIMRLEAVPIAEMNQAGASSIDAPNANAPIGFESMRLPNGVWMPDRSWYNSYGREKLFWKTGISRARKFSDFKLSNTEVKDITIDEPKSQQ